MQDYLRQFIRNMECSFSQAKVIVASVLKNRKYAPIYKMYLFFLHQKNIKTKLPDLSQMKI